MKIMKRLIRDEKGQAMVLVLVLLLVGGLLVSSLLAYMGTGLLTGRVYERRTAELYAADAGVEDAVWKIEHGDVTACPAQPNQPPFNINVNGKNVTVTITLLANNTTYHVESTATGDGSGTQIDAYVTTNVTYDDYSGITENIITSQGEIDVANKVDLIYPPENAPEDYYDGDWPEPDALAQFYWQDVKDAVPYTLSTLNVENYATGIGPFYRNGTLDIVNTGANGLTLKLNGTVYITGDTKIGSTNQEFTLDLNGHTIFVSSNTTGNQKALIIGGKCTVQGPGVIIAVGDLEFKPKAQAGGESKPIFVLSVSGTTTLQPSGNYYGAIAGSVEVEVQAGTKPTITYPTGGFGTLINFPTLFETGRVYSIASWDINQQ